jgi:hypothetical protein
VWADTLLLAEQQHLLRLFVWAALSILAGTAIGVLLAVRRARSPLLTHFAIQMAGWGVAVAIIAGIWWANVHIRDLSGATRLERFVWMSAGFDVGVIALGATVGVLGRRLAHSVSSVGAGAAIFVQGLGLFLLDLHFAALIAR